MPSFILYYPEKQKRWRVEFQGDRFVIGRAREAEICVPHPSVSKQHVVVERKGSRYVYRDLGSKNGVYVNDFRMDKGTLDDGDELRVGSIIVKFYSEKPPASAAEASQLPGAPTALELGALEDAASEEFDGSATISIPSDALAEALDAPAGRPRPGPERRPGQGQRPGQDQRPWQERRPAQEKRPVEGKPAAQEKRPVEGKPAAQEKHPVPAKHPVPEERSEPEERPAREKRPVSERPAQEQRPVSERPVREQRPVSERLAHEQRPVHAERPVREARSVRDAGPVREDRPVEQDRPVPEERPAARPRPAPSPLLPPERPAREGPRRISRAALLAGGAICLLLGFGLGYLASRLDPPREAARPPDAAAGDSRAAGPNGADSSAGGSGSRAAQGPAGREAAAPESPLGPPTDLKDPETAMRLCVRLYLDFAERPPSREELRALLKLSHERLWLEVKNKATAAAEVPAGATAEAFERLLGRKPTPDEHSRLLELAKDDADWYTFHVGTSREYARAGHRRKRSERQLARSLFTDLSGSPPAASQEARVLDALRSAGGGVAPAAKTLLDPAASSLAAPGGEEPPEAWLRETYARLLLRFPTPEEASAALQALQKGGDAWRAVLLELVSRKEYLEY